MPAPLVAILMGSSSDLPILEPAADVLGELGIPVEVRVMSAHRTPERVVEFVKTSARLGVRVFICGAGGAAHLAGAVAAQTVLPVIGVPIGRSLGGLDSLYATVQMPPGMPVATVAVDGAVNAGLLAASILSLADRSLEAKLQQRRDDAAAKIAVQDDEVRAKASRLIDRT
jgi:5-(carboxyamino)imidazole ribonucleotide mutase